MTIRFFDQFFAKSDGVTTLQMHTQHVITAGKNLLKSLSLTKQEREYWEDKLFRCAVLHDLGKIHSEFQRRLNGAKDVSIRHEIISLWFCENFLQLSPDELFAIATHHKGIVRTDGFKRLEMDSLKNEMQNHYESNQDLLTEQVLLDWLSLMGLNASLKSQEIETSISKQSIRTLHYLYQKKTVPESEDRKAFSQIRALLIAADHLGSARMENSIPVYRKILLEEIQPRSKDNQLFPFRNFQVRLQSVNTDVILHAPTGSGKTEAALSWVYANQIENARLFYLLPYTASINAMVKRLQKIFGEDKVTALHSKTLDFFYDQLSNEDSNSEKDYVTIEKSARTKQSLSFELFYPVKVVTLHQIIKTSLKGKGWEMALYDYNNALFIIDEFHTYNALLTGLLLASIKLFRNIFKAKFFFMSATIPDFMLNKIVQEVFAGDYSKLIRPDPSKESDNEILNKERHILLCQPSKSILDDLSLITDFLKSGKSVLVIVNNVKTAQDLYKVIEFNGTKKLLHSGFHKKDRIAIEKEITNEEISKRPQLLIATQAVEVSLDIDYDVALTENAPIDALIQRFGRVNRAGKKAHSSIYLYEKIIGNTKYFYEEQVLAHTWQHLYKLNNQLLSEQKLVDVCNQVYANGYNENQSKDFENGLTHPIIQNFESDWIAGDWNNWVDEVLEKDNQKIEVLCSNLLFDAWDGESDTLGYDNLIIQKRYIEANQLLVQVYFYEIKDSNRSYDEKRNAIVVYDLLYDSEIGYKKKDSNDDNFL